MKISDIKTERTENSKRTIIDINPIYTADEIIKIIDVIENTYGGIDEIICLDVNDNKQIENNRFETLDSFIQEFDDDAFIKSSMYIVKVPYLSKEFIIDRKANKYVILTTIEKDDCMGIKYYLVDDSDIFKRDEKKENFYRLEKDTKEWIRVPSMIGLMNDGTFNFVEITKEEVDKYTERI